MYFLVFSSRRNEKKNEKKMVQGLIGLLPKQCHDTMEYCIVTWPKRCAVGSLYCNMGGVYCNRQLGMARG